MIIFEKLTYQNFLSTGEIPTEIDLDAAQTTLIIGTNGMGKSSMIDALSFVLFNKAHRKINRPQLINSINNKKCLVSVNFRIGKTAYRVIRGMKPNIFEIWQDGRQLNQEANSRDYQKILETNILKLNHKSFHQIVVLGSSNFIPFMQLPTYQRRGVIEELLDIGIFSKMNFLLKEELSKMRDMIKDTEHQINLSNEKIKLQSKHLNELKRIDELNSKKIEIEISNLRNDVDSLEKKNELLNQQYNSKAQVLQNKITSKQKILNSLTQYEQQIKFKIKDSSDHVSFYETNEVCPTCSQDISRETKNTKIHECKTKICELDSGYIKIRDELKNVGNDLAIFLKAQNELSAIPTKISVNHSSIRSAVDRIRELDQQLKSSKDDNNTEQTSLELQKSYERRNMLSELRLKQIEERTYNEVISELLKDTGIKTKIIKQYLPVMNRLINQYLQTLDFFVSFHLDENFNEIIKSRHRDDFSYASFSEGEKARIDLSLLFAWRQIARMKNSANTNLLVLDEVMDGSVDGDGIDCFMQILGTLDENTRTFIISHKQEYSESRFDRCLKFTKKNNFSSCSSIN